MLCGSPEVTVDNGLGWSSLLCSRNSRHTDFVSFGFLFFSFFPLVMVMWESKFSAMVAQYFKSETR